MNTTESRAFTGRNIHIATLVSNVHCQLGGWAKVDFIETQRVINAAAVELGFPEPGFSISTKRANAIVAHLFG